MIVCTQIRSYSLRGAGLFCSAHIERPGVHSLRACAHVQDGAQSGKDVDMLQLAFTRRNTLPGICASHRVPVTLRIHLPIAQFGFLRRHSMHVAVI